MLETIHKTLLSQGQKNVPISYIVTAASVCTAVHFNMLHPGLYSQVKYCNQTTDYLHIMLLTCLIMCNVLLKKAEHTVFIKYRLALSN